MSDRSAKASGNESDAEDIRSGSRASEDVATHEERRATPRYAFTATAEVVDTKSRTRMHTRISDLGLEGCYVDTNAPFPINTSVRIRITASKKVFECLGEVVYSLPNMGMGISFAEPKPVHREILKEWIGQLSGEAPADFEGADSDASASTDSPANDAQLFVLQELVHAMMRAKTITEPEGKALLHRLGR